MRIENAKRYAEQIAVDCEGHKQVISATVARYGLNRAEKTYLAHHVYKVVSFKCDRTLCGSRSLLAARLPLNRIAEVFA